MKNKLLFIAVLFVVFALPGFLKAQVTNHPAGWVQPCYSDEMDAELVKKNPEILIERAKLEAFTKQWAKEHANERMASTYKIIPVVFHILHNYGNENISEAQIKDGIRVWNEDYEKLNPDITDVIPPFQGITASFNVEFRLATIDPNGNCTNGIDRIVTPLTYNAADNAKLNDWPNNKYLNVWVCGQIGVSGAAAYAQFPGGSNSTDGIMCQHNYVGSIGTGSAGTSRVLTHESGHCFNLEHVWGNGTCGVACNDDLVGDTPITKGWDHCPSVTAPNYPEWIVCNSGVVENVQNFMEYSYCCKMFTAGQNTRVQANLNSTTNNRSTLWSAANLAATGTADPYVMPLCTPVADFHCQDHIICTGTTVTFFDDSWKGAPSSWNWSFPGGSPSSSINDTQAVQYNTPGTYDVTLTSSNATGTSAAKIKTGYIIVLDSTSGKNPDFEGFDNTAFPPPNAVEQVPLGGNDWARYTGIGAQGSTTCMRIVNLSTANYVDALAEYITPAYSFKGVSGPAVSFWVSHSLLTNDTTRADELRVFYQVDCNGWTSKYFKSGGGLTTSTPRSYNSSYYPHSASDWRMETITGIFALANKSNVRFKFQNKTKNGNNTYVDNININGIVNDVEETDMAAADFDIYPNPAKNNPTIEINLNRTSETKMDLLDVTGRKISSIVNSRLAAGTYRFPLTENLQSGVYLITMTSGNSTSSKRLVILN